MHFLRKAVELEFASVALVAKRPHVSPLDYNREARRELRAKLADHGLELAAMMGTPISQRVSRTRAFLRRR